MANQAWIGAAEVYHPVALGAPGELARVLARVAGDQNFLGTAHQPPADLRYLLVDALLQQLQPLFFHRFRHIVFHIRRRRARAFAEDKAERGIKAHLGDQVHGIDKVLIGLAGKTNDKVRRELQIRTNRQQSLNFCQIVGCGVFALHHLQHPV